MRCGRADPTSPAPMPRRTWPGSSRGCCRRASRRRRPRETPAAHASAPALALTTGSGIQVVGAEHFQELVHPWSCSAVPVLDPRTGRTVGVLDVTGSADAVAPLVLPLLAATSRAVQEELRRQGPAAGLASVAGAGLLLTGRRAPLLRCGG